MKRDWRKISIIALSIMVLLEAAVVIFLWNCAGVIFDMIY